TMHLVEAIANVFYVVSHPCVVEENGIVSTVMVPETDHCCRGFRIADEWLRARDLQREGTIGSAHARLFSSRDLVAIAVERLSVSPLILLCPPSEACEECAVAYASIGVAANRCP